MSVYDGKAIKRDFYEYKEEDSDEVQLFVYGPINRKNNIGKYPSKKDVKYFFTLSSSLASEFTKKYIFNN